MPHALQYKVYYMVLGKHLTGRTGAVHAGKLNVGCYSSACAYKDIRHNLDFQAQYV